MQYPDAEAAFFWNAAGEFGEDMSAVDLYKIGTCSSAKQAGMV